MHKIEYSCLFPEDAPTAHDERQEGNQGQ
jgi:hypothetical protein